MTKSSRNLTFVFAAVVGIVILIGFALMATESGSRWLVYRLVPHISADLTINGVQGSLISGLSLDEVTHDNRQLKMHIKHIEFAWRPLAMLRKELHITRLHMKGVSIFLPAAEETFQRGAVKLPDEISLPVSIILDNTILDAVDIQLGEKSHKFERIHLSGQADKNGVRFEKFKASGKDIRLSFRGHGGLKKPYLFEIHSDWRAMLPRSSIPVKGEGHIEGNIQGGKATFKLGAPFVLETNVELQMNKDWSELAVIGNGKRKDVRQPLPVEIPDRGSMPRINFKQLEFQTLGGILTLQGLMNWQPELVLDLFIQGENIDPGFLIPDWPGKLEFQSKLQGEINAETIKVSLNKLKILGRLMDLPFELSGNLALLDDRPELVDLDIRSGKNKLKLRGPSDKKLNIGFELEILEPESLWPGLEGQWHGDGFVKQIDGKPAGALVLRGDDVTYGNFHIESYNGNFACDSVDTQKCSARVKLTNLQVDEEVFPDLSIDWMGDLKSHRVQVDLVSSTARANLGFEGECYSDTWKFKIDKASFDLDNKGTWQLNNEPVNLVVNHSGIQPFKACWAQNDSRTCVDGSWSAAEGWKTKGGLNAPPLNGMVDILKLLIQRPKLDKKYYKTGDIEYQ